MDAALYPDIGIKASLYGGLLASAARAGLQNSSLIPVAIQSIPVVGNMMIRYGLQINMISRGIIDGITKGTPPDIHTLINPISRIGYIPFFIYDTIKE